MTPTPFTRISGMNHRLGEHDEEVQGVDDLEFLRQLHYHVADHLELHVVRSNDGRLKIPVYTRAVNSKALGAPQEMVHVHLEMDFKLAILGLVVITSVGDGHQSNTVSHN